MLTIICHARTHREEERIFLDCAYGAAINSILKKIPGILWSQTHKQWHLPLTEESYRHFSAAIAGIAIADNKQLKAWLLKNKEGKAAAVPDLSFVQAAVKTPQQPLKKQAGASGSKITTATKKITPSAKNNITGATAAGQNIHSVNKHVLPALKQQLVLKAYSASTLQTYVNEVSQFLQTIQNHAADEFTAKRIKDYLQYCFETLGLSENTLHSRINALHPVGLK